MMKIYVHLVSILILTPPCPLTLCQPTIDAPRVLVTLALSPSSTVGVVTGVHGYTSDGGFLAHPACSAGFT